MNASNISDLTYEAFFRGMMVYCLHQFIDYLKYFVLEPRHPPVVQERNRRSNPRFK